MIVIQVTTYVWPLTVDSGVPAKVQSCFTRFSLVLLTGPVIARLLLLLRFNLCKFYSRDGTG